MLIEDTNVTLLIDKLCERWLVEKAGVDLYAATIEAGRSEGIDEATIAHLEHIRRQEKDHEELLEEVIRRFGHDPRERTTSVEVTQRQIDALDAIVHDGMAGFDGCLQALLAAELVDNAGWELLEDLCKTAPIDEDVVRAFRAAERHEREHLHIIRQMVVSRTHLELDKNNLSA